MGITPGDAADVLRGPLESGEIDAEARRWKLKITAYEPPYLLDLDEPFDVDDFTPMTYPIGNVSIGSSGHWTICRSA